MLCLGQPSLGGITATQKRWYCRLVAALVAQQPGQVLCKVVASHEADTYMSERLSAAFLENIEVLVACFVRDERGELGEGQLVIVTQAAVMAVPARHASVDQWMREHVIHSHPVKC